MWRAMPLRHSLSSRNPKFQDTTPKPAPDKQFRNSGPCPHVTAASFDLKWKVRLCELRKRLGMRRVTLHYHPRTTAAALLEYTHDVREVQALLGHKNLQSTFWYLDHAMRPIPRATLETIKRPFLLSKEKTA
jgi:integrase